MTPAEHLDDRTLVLQLHGVLSDIDPARWRDEAAGALKHRLEDVAKRLSTRSRLDTMAKAIHAELEHLESGTADLRTRWLAFKERLQPSYASLARALKAEKIHVPSLRPTNYARNLFHVGAAAVSVGVIELAPSPLVIFFAALGWATFAWTCEVSRRLSPAVNAKLMRFFGPVAHPHETHRVNSATWYATALVLLASTQSLELMLVAVAVLGVGDPMAALVGRRFGRIRLLHGRSLEGSLAFVGSGALVAFGALMLFHPALGAGAAAALALAGGLAGAVAELVSFRVDDNFSIPLSAAAGAALASWVLPLLG